MTEVWMGYNGAWSIREESLACMLRKDHCLASMSHYARQAIDNRAGTEGYTGDIHAMRLRLERVR